MFSKSTGRKIGITATIIGLIFADILLIMAGALAIASNQEETV